MLFSRTQRDDEPGVAYEIVDDYCTVYGSFDDLSTALNIADGMLIRRKVGAGVTRPLYVDEVQPDGTRRRAGQAA